MKRYIQVASTKKTLILIALNVCFFSYVAYWIFHNIDFGNLSQRLRETPPRALFTAMTLNVFVLFFFAKRLSLILGGRLIPCLLITTVGFTCNAVAPFRLGEGVKIWFGGASCKYPLMGLGVAVAAEKLYDASAIAVLSLIVAASSHAGVIGMENLLVLPALAAAAALVVFIVKRRFRSAMARLLEWRFAEAFELGLLLEQARSTLVGHNVLGAAFCTLSIWSTNTVLVFVTFRMLLQDVALSLLDAMTMVLIAALAIAVPASPAGLGVLEAGLVAYLTRFHGVEKEQALSAALAYHFAITAPHTLIVLVFLGASVLRLLRTRSTARS
jgi:hypothetical protein